MADVEQEGFEVIHRVDTLQSVDSCEKQVNLGYVHSVCEVESGVYAACGDAGVHIWNTVTEIADDRLVRLGDHTGTVRKVEMIKRPNDQRLLLSCSEDHTAKVWNPKRGYQCIATLYHAESVNETAQWGETLITVTADTLYFWDINNFECYAILQAGQDRVVRLCTISAQNEKQECVEYLASLGKDSSVKIWNDEFKCCAELVHKKAKVTTGNRWNWNHWNWDRAMVQYKDKLAVGYGDRIRIWNIKTWEKEDLLGEKIPCGKIMSLCILDMGGPYYYLVAGCSKGYIWFWNFNHEGKPYCPHKLKAFRMGEVTSLLSTSEQNLVSTSQESFGLKLWKLQP